MYEEEGHTAALLILQHLPFSYDNSINIIGFHQVMIILMKYFPPPRKGERGRGKGGERGGIFFTEIL
jgi:hypothetical protein